MEITSLWLLLLADLMFCIASCLQIKRWNYKGYTGSRSRNLTIFSVEPNAQGLEEVVLQANCLPRSCCTRVKIVRTMKGLIDDRLLSGKGLYLQLLKGRNTTYFSRYTTTDAVPHKTSEENNVSRVHSPSSGEWLRKLQQSKSYITRRGSWPRRGGIVPLI